MDLYINLLTYFILYSFLGWCIESIFKTICEKQLVNSGFLYGPFCPIYGCGAIIMYLFLDDIKSKPVIIFCIGFVILSLWEYIVGIVLEKIFHRKYWDYSNNKFNLQGRVCLLNSFFWGVLSVIFIDLIHPFINGLLTNIDQQTIMYCDIIIAIALIIDAIVSICNNFSIATKIKRVEELNNIIKEKLVEIRKKGKGVEQSMQDTLEELKQKRTRIIRKSYRTILRLKRAFPSLKSEEFTKFLNEKREFFKKP